MEENPKNVGEGHLIKGFFYTFYMLDLNKQQRMLGNNLQSARYITYKCTKATAPGQDSVGTSQIPSASVTSDRDSSFQFAQQRRGRLTSGPKAALPSIADRHLNIQASSWVFRRFSFRAEDLQTLGNKSKYRSARMIDVSVGTR